MRPAHGVGASRRARAHREAALARLLQRRHAHAEEGQVQEAHLINGYRVESNSDTPLSDFTSETWVSTLIADDEKSSHDATAERRADTSATARSFTVWETEDAARVLASIYSVPKVERPPIFRKTRCWLVSKSQRQTARYWRLNFGCQVLACGGVLRRRPVRFDVVVAHSRRREQLL